MDTLQRATWNKKALDFIRSLGNLATQQDPEKLLQISALELKNHAGADHVFFLQRQDHLAAKIVASDTDRFKDKVIPSDLFSFRQLQVFEDFTPNRYNRDFLGGTVSLVVVPIIEPDFEVWAILGWKEKFSPSPAFMSFLEVCHFRLSEVMRLAQISLSLEQAQVRYQAILQTIPQAIVFVDNTGHNSWINERAGALLGIPPGEVSPAAISQAMSTLRSMADNQQDIYVRSLELANPDSTIRDWIWIFTHPVNCVLSIACTPAISRNTHGRLWVFDEITEQYRAAEKLRALNLQLEEKTQLADAENRAKSEFLANMSHEIRTPMNGVIGMTSLLVRTPLTEQQREYVETIRLSGETLLTLINDILDFSKIESGKLELEQQPFAPYTVIEETFDLFSLRADEKGLDLLYMVDPEVPALVTGDITRIRQILVNLVSNAIKFTEKGEVMVSIHKQFPSAHPCELKFAVRDTGIGIPAAKFDRLFRSFSQVDASTTRKYGGTGLGLAICNRLVELMNGKMWVESTAGQGSTFFFTLHLAEATEAAPSVATYEPNILYGKSVLLLDDNLTNLKILETKCQQWHMETVAASSGRQALQILENNSFDLAIFDMLMPGMDGIETTRLAKKIRPALPVVLFSSAGSFVAVEEGDRSLFAALIDKPVKQHYLYNTLIRVVGNISQGEKKEPKNNAELIKAEEKMKISILVAEDNHINQRIIIKTLETLGYKADIASNGVEVLESLDRQSYDLILMDVQMPEMDGYEATRQIGMRYEAVDRPLIIAMTANALEGDEQKCLEAGMDDYLSKPFKLPDVEAKLSKWKERLTGRS